MCNVNCIKWGANNVTEKEVMGKRVIEVGSYDVNGSLRYLIKHLRPSGYIGIDITNGPGVDIICPVEKMAEKFNENSFDLVICTCVLEHVRYWKEAVSNLKKICKPNGIILLIVPSKWTFHEFPYDFWRYDKEDIKEIFSDCEMLILEEDPKTPSLVYAKIRKPVNFVENDLSNYELYSVICGKKRKEIFEKDFRSLYFRYLLLKAKIKERLIKAGRKMF